MGCLPDLSPEMYNVWVGRRENEHYLSRDKAYAIAQKYIDKGCSVSVEERYTDGRVYIDVMVELPKEED